MDITGVVLAGGASTRMGRDKAYVEVAGRSMLDWVTHSLEQVTSDVVIVGRQTAGAFRAVPDELPRRGPLGGVATALRTGSSILVVAVDQPFVRVETLRALWELGTKQLTHPTPRPVVPHADEFAQVTCAFYPANFLEAAAQALEDGSSLRTALAAFGYEAWTNLPEGEDGRSWFSIDTPEALEEALRRFQPPI